jgi:hypothetical protein
MALAADKALLNDHPDLAAIRDEHNHDPAALGGFDGHKE